MKIKYIGHSCFLITSENGTSIATDPYDGVGIPMPKLTADAVTVSHAHFDHCNVMAVKTKKVIDRAGKYQIGDIAVSARKHYHDEVKGRKRGETLVFTYLIDGISVCHLGDIGEDDPPADLKVDVLLIPVGGTYTIDAQKAYEYVKKLKPHIVIPMHYKAGGIKLDIASPDKFLQYFKDAERLGCAELALRKEELESYQEKVILLRGSAHGTDNA